MNLINRYFEYQHIKSAIVQKCPDTSITCLFIYIPFDELTDKTHDTVYKIINEV